MVGDSPLASLIAFAIGTLAGIALGRIVCGHRKPTERVDPLDFRVKGDWWPVPTAGPPEPTPRECKRVNCPNVRQRGGSC